MEDWPQSLALGEHTSFMFKVSKREMIGVSSETLKNFLETVLWTFRPHIGEVRVVEYVASLSLGNVAEQLGNHR